MKSPIMLQSKTLFFCPPDHACNILFLCAIMPSEKNYRYATASERFAVLDDHATQAPVWNQQPGRQFEARFGIRVVLPEPLFDGAPFVSEPAHLRARAWACEK